MSVFVWDDLRSLRELSRDSKFFSWETFENQVPGRCAGCMALAKGWCSRRLDWGREQLKQKHCQGKQYWAFLHFVILYFPQFVTYDSQNAWSICMGRRTENRTRMYFILQANSIVYLILFREPYRQFYSPTTGHFLSHDIPVLQTDAVGRASHMRGHLYNMITRFAMCGEGSLPPRTFLFTFSLVLEKKKCLVTGLRLETT